MYIKIRLQETGDWDIREAKEIKYSDDCYHKTPNERNPYPHLQGLPVSLCKILEINGIYKYEQLENLHLDGSDFENCIYSKTIDLGQEMFADKYFYAILDKKQAVLFTTEAYIINNDGKTIAKIG